MALITTVLKSSRLTQNDSSGTLRAAAHSQGPPAAASLLAYFLKQLCPFNSFRRTAILRAHRVPGTPSFLSCHRVLNQSRISIPMSAPVLATRSLKFCISFRLLPAVFIMSQGPTQDLRYGIDHRGSMVMWTTDQTSQTGDRQIPPQKNPGDRGGFSSVEEEDLRSIWPPCLPRLLWAGTLSQMFLALGDLDGPEGNWPEIWRTPSAGSIWRVLIGRESGMARSKAVAVITSYKAHTVQGADPWSRP